MDERKKKNNESQKDEEEDEEKETKTILGIFTRQQFTIFCVAVGLVVLLLVVTVTSVVLTVNSGSGTFLVSLVMLFTLQLCGVLDSFGSKFPLAVHIFCPICCLLLQDYICVMEVLFICAYYYE